MNMSTDELVPNAGQPPASGSSVYMSKPGRYGKIQFTRGPVTFYYEQIGLKI